MVDITFMDRREAGKDLAQKLKEYRDSSVIIALPRGGVEMAVEVANLLNAPLDLVFTRKIGHPGNPEYAIGAVTETGSAVWNETEKAGLDDIWCNQAEASERMGARRRRLQYLAGREPISVTNKVAILIDDGIATGLTMQAAVNEIQKQKPNKVIVAAPVAPSDAVDTLLDQVDDVVVLINPTRFLGAVGAHYEDFPQLNDVDVTDLLEEIE